MTRVLPAVFVCTLLFARLAGAQSPDPTEAGATRLLVGPTARALEQGQFYVDFSAFVGGPFAQIGITDRVSIGAGTPILIPGLHPGDVMVITPKVQVYSGTALDVSVGALQLAGPKLSPGGIAYTVITHGTPDAAFTSGVGFTYGGGRTADGARKPVVLLGGEKRVTGSLKLLTENYAGSGVGLLCGGLRLTRGHRTLDVGVATLLGVDHPMIAPIFRFAWNL